MYVAWLFKFENKNGFKNFGNTVTIEGTQTYALTNHLYFTFKVPASSTFLKFPSPLISKLVLPK